MTVTLGAEDKRDENNWIKSRTIEPMGEKLF
jgi:hypothetical protein